MQVSLQYAAEHLAELASAARRGEEVEIAQPDEPPLILAPRSTVRKRTAPWHYLAFSKIHEMENTGQLYEGVGDLRIQPATAAYAMEIFDSLHDKLSHETLPNPTVSTVSGGGIGVRWTVGTKEVEMVIYPDDTASFVATKGDEVQSEDEFQGVHVDSLSKALRSMLQG
jgi:antitoxin (DNA-binding transcriptional repressor) of toxin-antitoxin stability system